MYSQFPLFQSHIDLAHRFWKELVIPGDIVIDATCGNGNDTLVLCELALKNDTGHVWAIDIQEEAINNTKALVKHHSSDRLQFIHGSHITFPKEIKKETVRLIVYNLGYLPGGDKSVTTQVASTLESIEAAQKLIMPGGAISITCYPGHAEGKKEEDAIVEWMSYVSPQTWSSFHLRSVNRHQAPSLILLQKSVS